MHRPNIILIVADDLGYGDVGCYGNPANATPHIDALADGGLSFTDFHTNGAVCSPTRAALLTGRYQQRAGIESALGENQPGLNPRELTIATCLQNAGYTTGMFGKWHLGMSLEEGPNRHGFQQFIGHRHGALDYRSHVTKFGDIDWWRNENLHDEDGYCTELITDHAVRFLEEQHQDPFFLYVPHSAIHFPWMAPEDPAHRQPGVRYEDLSRLGPHAPEDVGRVVKKMIEALDDSVGRIVGTVQDLGIEKETLILFTSDNGGIREYSGGFNEISSNGPFRDGKGSVYEGGHRVPAIAYWPGTIAPGESTDQTTMTMDLFPTFLTMTGTDAPNDRHIDGVDLRSLLLEQEPLSERSLFWRFGRKRAVRKGEWKLCALRDERELYNLSEDPSETNDLSQANPAIMETLETELSHWEQEVDP